MKVCTKCGESKELDEFGVDKRNKDGRRQPCKGCARAYNKAYSQTPGGRRLAAERKKRWRKANPDRAKEIQRDHYLRHREDYLRSMKEWRKANPEKARTAEARWREANKPRKSELQMRREARKRDQFVAPVDPTEILIRDRGHCGICGDPIMEPYHLDHIHPLAAGGTHEPDNVQLAHPACNWRKGITYEEAA